MAAKIFSLLLMIFAAVVAADPNPLQDLCVADIASGIKLNGYPCKDPAAVLPEDFWSDMLGKPGPTNNSNGVGVNAANVLKLPGVNTLGISLGRIDYAVGAVNPPHTHPRASEIVYVIEGDLEVGFITTANVLIAKQLKKGDLFVFPRALLHYQKNIGKTPAAVIAAFDSQFPGTQSVVSSLFAASPAISPDVLARSFKMDKKMVEDIKAKVAPKK